VVVDGIAGVGKSALAVEAARQLTHRFPDGHLYVDLQGSTPGLAPLAPAAVMHRLLQAVDPGTPDHPRSLDEASATFHARIAHRRLLLVLDNAVDANQVYPLLPTNGSPAVLITSRRMLTILDGVVHLHLDVLSEESAVTLLGRLLDTERVAAEPGAATVIARLCGGLPLALRIVGARLAARPDWSLGTFADRLRIDQTRLDQFQAGELTLRATFEVSYRALHTSADPVDRLAAGAFRLLGVLDEPHLGVPAAATLLAAPRQVTEAALERLVDVRLAEEVNPGRYHLRDLLRLFAMEKAGSPATMRISELAASRAAMSAVRAAIHRNGAPAVLGRNGGPAGRPVLDEPVPGR
jgi:hypothetical protein